MTVPFLDTSVIIRLLTGDGPVKQAASAALFDSLERGQLSPQAPKASACGGLAPSRPNSFSVDHIAEHGGSYQVAADKA